MNKIAKSLCDGVLASFKSDSTGLEESSSVRAKERKDAHTGYFADLYSIITAKARWESIAHRTHENSFASVHKCYQELTTLLKRPKLEDFETYRGADAAYVHGYIPPELSRKITSECRKYGHITPETKEELKNEYEQKVLKKIK